MSSNEPFTEPVEDKTTPKTVESAGPAKDFREADQRPSELLEKETAEEESDKPMVSFSELFQYADGIDKTLMALGTFSAFINGAGMPLFSEIFGQMINELLSDPSNVEQNMADLAAIMCYVGLGVFVASTFQVMFFMIAASRQITRIRQRYFDAVLRQEMAWHDEHKPGALASRLSGDTRILQQGINDKVANGIYNFSMCIFGFAIGFYRSWELTLVMLGTLPLTAISGGIMAYVLTEMTALTRKGFAAASDVATEALDNVRSVQVFGTEEVEVARFALMLAPAKAAGIKKEFSSVGGVGVSYAIMFMSNAIAFWFSSYLIEWGRNDVGEIIAVYFAILLGGMGLGLVFPSIAAVSEARTVAYNIYKVIDRVVPIDIRKDGAPCDGVHEAIEFKNVAFSYPTRKDMKLFTDLNVTIHRGQKVAFSGASGSGKSSIVSLLQRFYDPDGGAVTVDGVDMKDLSLSAWRQNIGIVSQEPNLFSGSIHENVRIGKPDATEEEVIEACTKANIHHTILTLPNQYETKVGAVGSQLSGGQKQRLAIARAIIKNPQLLILDEATSALDRKSEVEVQGALDSVMTSEGGEKLTVVVIAHRLATIRNVDTIHYISYDGEKGSQIAESGTFDELMARDGEFAIMARRQAQDGGDSDNSANTSAAASPSNVAAMGDEDDCDDVIDAEAKKKSTGHKAIAIDGEEAEKPPTLEQLADKEVENADASTGRIVGMMTEKRWAIGLGFLGSLIAGGMYPGYAVVLSKMIELLGKKANDPKALRDETPLWAGLFIAIGAAALIGWVMQGFYAVAGEELTEKIRIGLFRNILRQDATFFDTPGRDSSALAGLLAGDTEAIHQLFGPSLGFKVLSFCNIAAGIAIACVYSWKLALVTASTIPCMVLAGAMQTVLMVGFGKSTEEVNEDTIVGESLNNIRTVTSFHIQDVKTGEYDFATAAQEPGMKRNGVIAGVVFGFSQFTFYGVFALAFWYGGKLIADGELEFIDVMIASMAVLFGAMGVGEAGSFAGKVADAQGAAQRVFAVLDRTPPIDPQEKDKKPVPSSLDIELHRLRFEYPARPDAPVLQGVSSRFKDRATVGLMGSTGCGKSTIMQMLCRFYDPDSGYIKIGSGEEAVDLRDIDLEDWRQQCAIVLQEPALFSGTVRENISYGLRHEVTDDEIEHAARLACIHDIIMDMPDGYETDVGYKGRQLSGGQKQRVAIARALLRRPKLLFLDEATSALDNATEAKVMEGIIQAVSESPMGIVSIAHRLTTIERSDKILLLDSGKIAEEGSHRELMVLDGEYRKRYELFTQSAASPTAE